MNGQRSDAIRRHRDGLGHRARGDLDAAARCFLQAIVTDPLLFDAGQALAETIAAEVREGRVPLPPLRALPPVLPSIAVVVCSHRPQRYAKVAELYRALLAPAPFEIVGIHDARSLGEGYNRGVRSSRGEVIVFSHDDVDVLAPDFLARLAFALSHVDVVGVAGATRLAGPAWGWAGHPHVHGWITHRPGGQGDWRPAFWSPFPAVAGAVVLDGVFLAVRRRAVEAVPFDEVTFDGFHGYDVDFTWRAARAGFRLGVCGSLGLVHESLGAFDARWQHYASRLMARYQECNGPQHPSHRYEVTLPSPALARAFHSRLESLAAAIPRG